MKRDMHDYVDEHQAHSPQVPLKFTLQVFEGPPADGRIVLSMVGLTADEVGLVSTAVNKIIVRGYFPGVVITFPEVEQPTRPFNESEK
jgi:hypothetical protein